MMKHRLFFSFSLDMVFYLILSACFFVCIPGSLGFAADLTSISVTPADPAILVGETQQFTATGTFSDGNKEALTSATAVTTGHWHTCALLPDGTIKCWGSNSSGQLGNGSTISSSTPVMVSGITTATAISAGALHTCALLSDGTVKCWGYKYYGQLGNGTTFSSYTPVSVSGISNATAVAAGNNHTCAVLSDGTIKCWGDNTYGQLGNGTTISSNTPVSVSGVSNAISVAAGSGYSHTCALLTDGSVKCWGSNSSGQLGNGSMISSSSPVPVSGISNATTIAAGFDRTCVVLADGTVKCWGRNATTPAAVPEISNAVDIAVGTNHICAVLSDGTARCWGSNWSGELGNGTLTISTTPVLVSGISNASKIAAGYNYTCALLSDNKVKCWGYNDSGQLGNGLIGHSVIPLSVSGVSNAARITAGSNFACALLDDATVKCWGLNRSGQLGNGSTGYSTTPLSVIGISNALSIAAGVSQTCVVSPDKTIQCWGSSYAGNGVSVSSVESIAVGRSHACVLLTDGTVKCWGSNVNGQLGNGSNTNSNIPVPVIGISNATAIAAGTNHTCAVLSDGAVKCWGLNDYGQLGDGTNTNSNTPVSITGITNSTTLSAGYAHTCALLSDGTLKCWGANYWGQLGNGSQINSNTPVSVSGISNVVTVTIGVEGGFTCALLSDATIKCWGSNIYGQLGNGVKGYAATTPVSVSGITNASAVATGNGHTCAILSDSSIKCWGNNWYGELGDGTAGISAIPDQVIGIVNVECDSSNEAVATIDTNGLATGISPGSTTISAASDGFSGSTTLTVNPPLPSAPLDFSAVAGDRQITLSWAEVIGVSSYNLYMASEPGVTRENYSLLAGGMRHAGVTTPYIHTGLTNGTTYYFIVTAVNDGGESNASNEVSAQPGIFISDINFVDPNLSACVNELGLIYAHELTVLSCVNRGINNLSGIEFLTNLNTLNLSMNNISDITPVASLINLAILNLSQNSITNISPLGGLTDLAHISLSGNLVSSITPLRGLMNLVSLHLGDNNITDVTPLASLVDLTGLMLYTNQIIDVTPLKGLINLRTLQLQQNIITTGVSNLVSLVNATLIDLRDNTAIPCKDLNSLVAALGAAIVTSPSTCDSQGLPPAVPQDLKAIPGYGQVTLSWRAVSWATSYNLYMASAPGVTKDNYSLLAGGMKHGGVTSPYMHTGLSYGAEYYFVVTAVNDVGESAPSSEVSASLISQWMSIGPEGGIIHEIVVSPNFTIDQTLFAGTFGGVFKSTDGGTTWNSTSISFSSNSDSKIEALAISPNYATDQTLFAGTLGWIFKSTNGGGTWNPVGMELNISGVYSLAISPNYTTDQTIFAGTWGGEVFKSTDGGATWISASNGLSNFPVYALAISPNYSIDRTLVSGTYGGGVFKSTDGGTIWTGVNSGLSNAYVYDTTISPNYQSDQTLFVGTIAGVFKSTNSGISWTTANAGLGSTYINGITISPNYENDQTLFAGAWTGGSYSGGVFKSINAGTSWTQVNTGLSSLSVETLAISPGYTVDQTIFAGTYGGGVFKSTDGGSSWVDRNAGLRSFLVYPYSLVVSPDYTSDQTLFAGTYGGGVFKSTDGGTSWLTANSGLSDDALAVRRLAISPDYVTDHTLYAGTYEGLFKSTDGGATWTDVSTGMWELGHGVFSLVISPNYTIDQTLFAGTVYSGDVYKSTDAGMSWTQVTTGSGNLSVESLVISPNYASDQTLFAGTWGEGVFKSTDGGATWTAFNTGLSSLEVMSLAITPTYATDQTLFAGTWWEGVFKSTDGGTSWISVHGNYFNARSLEISPAFVIDRTIFAGISGWGGFKSTDGGATWTAVNTGLSNLWVGSLAISPGYPCDGTIFAGTEFSSVWKYLDFEAIATCLPSIRGIVTENGVGLVGVTVTLSGDASAVATTEPDGTYIFTGLPDGSYTIAPSKEDYLFDPPSRSVTVSGGDVIDQDFSGSITPDTIMPETTILSGPVEASCITSASVTLSWSGSDNNDGALTYSYQMDGNGWSLFVPSTSMTYDNLSEGPHTFSVKAMDSSGNIDATPAALNFNVDMETPALSNITSSPRDYNAAITWNTSEPVTAQVEYGETSVYGMSSPLDTTMTGAHIVIIDGLTPNTMYHYRVKSSDGCREVVSGDMTFTTTDILYPNLHVTQIDMPATVKSLEQVNFRWLVRNDGPGFAEGNWTDKVFLSGDEILDSQDSLLVEFNFSDGMVWETERWRATTIGMPAMPAGTYYIVVQTDANDGIIESNENDNNLTKQIDYLKVKQLGAAPDQISVQLVPGEVISGSIDLINFGDNSLTGITAEVQGSSPNINIQAPPPSSIDGKTVQKVSYSVTASDDSVASNIPVLMFSSAEGQSAGVTFNITVNPGHPNLVSNPGYLEKTMVRGAQTFAEFEIMNNGSAAVSNLKIILPFTDWLSLVTPDNISSLGRGEKTRVSLALKPRANLQLGPYTGDLSLSADNAGAKVNFRFTAVSDKIGGLKIVAKDEFTYFAADHPPVSGAAVRISNPYDGTVIAEGITDADGLFAKNDLFEGLYRIEVSAEKHGTFNAIVQINPGQIREITAFLPRQLVTYSWKVVPVETEDRYIVTLEAVFESHVPAPVITVEPTILDLSKLQYDADGRAMVNYTVTNHGLIAANGATIRFGSHPDYEMTAISENIGEVPAMTSMVIPVEVSKLSSTSTSSSSDCGIPVVVDYYYVCENNQWRRVNVYAVTGVCPQSAMPSISAGYGGSGGSGGRNGGSSSDNQGGVVSSTASISGPSIQQSVPCSTGNSQCDFSSVPGEIERCFGGVGSGCSGNAGPGAPFVRDEETCYVTGWMSVGSILHDRCCLQTNNEGYQCGKGGDSGCVNEWREAKGDTICGRQWLVNFGPYTIGSSGDSTDFDLKAPSGAKVSLPYENYCQSGSCDGRTPDLCGSLWEIGPYCVCQ